MQTTERNMELTGAPMTKGERDLLWSKFLLTKNEEWALEDDSSITDIIDDETEECIARDVRLDNAIFMLSAYYAVPRLLNQVSILEKELAELKAKPLGVPSPIELEKKRLSIAGLCTDCKHRHRETDLDGNEIRNYTCLCGCTTHMPF